MPNDAEFMHQIINEDRPEAVDPWQVRTPPTYIQEAYDRLMQDYLRRTGVPY